MVSASSEWCLNPGSLNRRPPITLNSKCACASTHRFSWLATAMNAAARCRSAKSSAPRRASTSANRTCSAPIKSGLPSLRTFRRTALARDATESGPANSTVELNKPSCDRHNCSRSAAVSATPTDRVRRPTASVRSPLCFAAQPESSRYRACCHSRGVLVKGSNREDGPRFIRRAQPQPNLCHQQTIEAHCQPYKRERVVQARRENARA